MSGVSRERPGTFRSGRSSAIRSRIFSVVPTGEDGGEAAVAGSPQAAAHERWLQAYHRGFHFEGLSPEQLALCEQVIKLPMRGQATSLNLAVAAGVLLYDMLAKSTAD